MALRGTFSRLSGSRPAESSAFQRSASSPSLVLCNARVTTPADSNVGGRPRAYDDALSVAGLVAEHVKSRRGRELRGLRIGRAEGGFGPLTGTV